MSIRTPVHTMVNWRLRADSPFVVPIVTSTLLGLAHFTVRTRHWVLTSPALILSTCCFSLANFFLASSWTSRFSELLCTTQPDVAHNVPFSP